MFAGLENNGNIRVSSPYFFYEVYSCFFIMGTPVMESHIGNDTNKRIAEVFQDVFSLFHIHR